MKRFFWLLLLFVPAIPLAMTYGLLVPPVVLQQGEAHRIFYIHVPVAWVALYAPLISAVCGFLFLFTRRQVFDRWNVANARIAVLFSLGVVISGPIWAHTAWGTFWNFSDPRLMSFFILLLCLGGYFLVRLFTDDVSRRAVYSALWAIIAAAASIFTWLAIRVLETDLHPGPVLKTMAPEISRSFWYNVLAYHLLFWLLLVIGLQHERSREIEEELEAK
ncbi:MAG: cytochrome c biogenesis protein CcsA [Leptospiraceae bacterium]|mgnify:CR=1 FL=1|nr:cytochrome c biogenesis protein CcsA [Leptospiraceae bacterium]MCB1305791.1 cytochrome c biogenesis protein CcsA [Leptospiraceae bacterium]